MEKDKINKARESHIFSFYLVEFVEANLTDLSGIDLNKIYSTILNNRYLLCELIKFIEVKMHLLAHNKEERKRVEHNFISELN